MTKLELSADARHLAGMIDHTILKPDATRHEISKFCDEAREFGFYAVCVNPLEVAFAADQLKGSPVKVCSVIAFPFGATTSKSKEAEAADALANGAREIDMVIAIGALKEGRLDDVRADIEAVRAATSGAILKVILETAMLTDPEKRLACQLVQEAGADFVKTSTGYGGGGATIADIALMRQTVGPLMGVKASGGVRTYEAAKAMIAAGATRIGTSSGLAIIGQTQGGTGGY